MVISLSIVSKSFPDTEGIKTSAGNPLPINIGGLRVSLTQKGLRPGRV